MGIRRVPELFPPVAYSRLPKREFTRGTDTGLVFQVSEEWDEKEIERDRIEDGYQNRPLAPRGIRGTSRWVGFVSCSEAWTAGLASFAPCATVAGAPSLAPSSAFYAALIFGGRGSPGQPDTNPRLVDS